MFGDFGLFSDLWLLVFKSVLEGFNFPVFEVFVIFLTPFEISVGLVRSAKEDSVIFSTFRSIFCRSGCLVDDFLSFTNQ